MNPIMSAELVNTAGNIGAGLINFLGGSAIQDRQNEQNLKLWREQWEAQKAYNDPKAQMERLKAAGLNPKLAYGGATTTLQVPSAPRVEKQKPDFKNPLEGYATIRNLDLQRENIQASNAVQNANLHSIEADTTNKKIDSAIKLQALRSAKTVADNAERDYKINTGGKWPLQSTDPGWLRQTIKAIDYIGNIRPDFDKINRNLIPKGFGLKEKKQGNVGGKW